MTSPYHYLILSRVLVRAAIVVASLAWAGFVFTQTIGDPGRGEQIAAAVLADDAARAEVVRPIGDTVMRSAGLPPEVRPVVDGEIDRALRDPRGAQAFIDPFAGSWARLLGEDDPRPTEFDLVPLLDQLVTVAPPDAIGDRLPVPGVPLPRTRLGWMDDVRTAVAISVLPLALLAVALFATAYAIGDRARVLRRFGAWAVAAGLAWVALPPIAVWAASKWAPGADSVVAVGLAEAVSGLLPVALVLAGSGLTAFAASFAVRPARDRSTRGAGRGVDRRVLRAAPRGAAARPPMTNAPVTQTMPRTRRVDSTAEMPAVDRPTTPTPIAEPVREPAVASIADPAHDDDRDDLWDYYSSS